MKNSRRKTGDSPTAASEAQENVERLTEWTAEQEKAAADASDLADTVDAQAAADLAEADRLMSDAEADLEEAEELVAELTLAYSEDIAAARSTLATAALGFACDWGTSQAVDGVRADAISGSAALSAFTTSDLLSVLRESREIAAAIAAAATLREDRYGVSTDSAEAAAVDCWQKEDAKLNAELYKYQDTLRRAVLEAACTAGASQAYKDWAGYWRTVSYLNWELTVGAEAAAAYEESVTDRFGSIEEFVAIPDADIQTESARCEDDRDLIEPKSDGTWNIGSEIMPGTWKAFDQSDCYWARLAENGTIRANHYGDALRITVNVQSSDAQFEISGCLFVYANP